MPSAPAARDRATGLVDRARRRRLASGALAQIDHSARCPEEVHSENAADLEAIVHLANLDIEAVQTSRADGETLDPTDKDVLVTADAAQPAKPISASR